jgi:hypothetical protein
MERPGHEGRECLGGLQCRGIHVGEEVINMVLEVVHAALKGMEEA